MSELTLFSMPSSGNSYKARLLLAFLGLAYNHVGLEYETEALAEAQQENTSMNSVHAQPEFQGYKVLAKVGQGSFGVGLQCSLCLFI